MAKMNFVFFSVLCLLFGSLLVDGQIQEWLDAHNTVRCGWGQTQVTWSAQLAADAQSYADSCPLGHNGALLQSLGQGENLAWSSQGGAYSTPASATGGWASEVEQWTCSNNGCSGVCGHFTQMTWSTVTQIGCGYRAGCPQWFHTWVCRYNVFQTGGRPFPLEDCANGGNTPCGGTVTAPPTTTTTTTTNNNNNNPTTTTTATTTTGTTVTSGGTETTAPTEELAALITIRYDAEIADYIQNGAYTALVSTLRTNMAALWPVSETRIRATSIREGSIIVEWSVFDDPTNAVTNGMELTLDLQQRIANGDPEVAAFQPPILDMTVRDANGVLLSNTLNSGPSVGLIAGIVGGLIVAALLVVGIILFVRWWRQRDRTYDKSYSKLQDWKSKSVASPQPSSDRFAPIDSHIGTPIIASPPPQPNIQARVLWDYIAQQPHCLTVFAGELVEVMERTNAEWWDVKNSVGQVGFIPANYCRPVVQGVPEPASSGLTTFQYANQVQISPQNQTSENVMDEFGYSQPQQQQQQEPVHQQQMQPIQPVFYAQQPEIQMHDTVTSNVELDRETVVIETLEPVLQQYKAKPVPTPPKKKVAVKQRRPLPKGPKKAPAPKPKKKPAPKPKKKAPAPKPKKLAPKPPLKSKKPKGRAPVPKRPAAKKGQLVKVKKSVKSPRHKGPAPMPPVKQKQRQLRALFAYTAMSEKERSFQAGDILTVLADQQGDWWYVKNAQGESFYAPCTFVKLI